LNEENVLLLLHHSSSSWAADCPTQASLVDIDSKLGAAEQTYADLDVEAFGCSLDEAALLLCLSEPIEPTYTACLYREIDLQLFASLDLGIAVS